LAIKLPETLVRFPIDALNLSVRSQHALKSHQIENLGQLVEMSDEALLGIRALGAKSLAEIRGTIAAILSSYDGIELREIDTAETANSSQPRHLSPGGWALPPYTNERLDSPVELLDLSVRPTNALKRLNLYTVRQLINHSKRELALAENMGRKSIDEISSKLIAYLSCDSNLDGDPEKENSFTMQAKGAKEFIDKMLAVLPERQRSIIADRYGLWDGIAETLQDVGDKLGITRERVRQIEATGLKRIRRLNGHGKIKQFILDHVRYEIEANKNATFGVLTEEEALAALTPDCTGEESALAGTFLQDIQSPAHRIFAGLLMEVENEIYCVDKSTADDYSKMLRSLELRLRSLEKPLTLNLLTRELKSFSGNTLTQEELSFARRILSVSSKFVRLRNGTIALSQWTEFSGQNAPKLAEAALRLLGKPAHFKEITEKANSIVEESRALTAGTIHNALIENGEKFVRVKSGTFGLAVWGLKKPPYVKDRLVEVLSVAGYPMPLWHLEQKVLEVCNCKPTSVRMTLDLNPQVFSRFAEDQYGLHMGSAKPKP
jgi:hypothetical protein